MNIFAAAKKSFSSKLLVLVLAAFMGFGGLVPMAAFAQSSVGGYGYVAQPISNTYKLTEPFKTVTQDGVSFSVTSARIDRQTYLGTQTSGALVTHSLKRGESKSYGTLGSTDTNDFDSYQFAALKFALEQKGVTGVERGNVFAISSELGTTYYVGQGGAAKMVAVATADQKLYIPNQPVTKLGGDASLDAGITDPTTEAGFLNLVDKAEGRRVGTLAVYARSSDTSDGAMNLKAQQIKELNKQLTDLDNKIAALPDGKEKDALIDQRTTLQAKVNQQEAINNKSAANAQGNSINLDSCNSIFSFFTFKCLSGLIAIVFNIGLKMCSYLLGVVGMLFDYSIELAINSAEFVEALGVVNPLWTFIRDILNMTFIFILLWIAANLILGRKGYTIKKQVPAVVIVAILINFSLFAAKLMVDGSNLATLQLYESSMVTTKANPTAAEPGSTSRISSTIMNVIGLPTIYNFTDIFTADGLTTTITGCGNAHGAIISVSIFGSLLMLILALAFLLAAVLFFSRLANIILLFITSPLWVWGFIMNTGVFKQSRDKWWKLMSKVLAFPIVYMMYIFVGVFAFAKLFGQENGVSFLTLFCTTTEEKVQANLVLILNFCLVIWLMMRPILYAANNATAFSNPILGKRFNDFSENMIKRFSGWQKGAVDGYKNAAKGTVTAPTRRIVTGISNGISNAAGRTAGNANRANWVRNLATRLSSATRDPKVFGKTQAEANKKWKEWRTGNAKANTADTVKASEESLGAAPKWREGESEDSFKERARKYAERAARIYLKSRILNATQTDKTETNAALLETATDSGLTKKADGTWEFNQTALRQQISQIRQAHAVGNTKGNVAHDRFAWLNQSRVEARQKETDAQARARVTSTGGKAKTKDNSVESLKDQLKQHEENLAKHPMTLDQLNVMLNSGNTGDLKGVFEVDAYKQHLKDIEELNKKIAAGPVINPMTGAVGSGGATDVAEWKRQIEAKELRIKRMKESVIKNRDKIQNTINETAEKIAKKEAEGKK